MKISIYIVDDLPRHYKRLALVFSEYDFIENVGQYHGLQPFDEALDLINHTKPMLLVLDWDLEEGGKNGIKLLASVEHPCFAIFCTTWDKEDVTNAILDIPNATYIPKNFPEIISKEVLNKRMKEIILPYFRRTNILSDSEVNKMLDSLATKKKDSVWEEIERGHPMNQKSVILKDVYNYPDLVHLSKSGSILSSAFDLKRVSDNFNREIQIENLVMSIFKTASHEDYILFLAIEDGSLLRVLKRLNRETKSSWLNKFRDSNIIFRVRGPILYSPEHIKEIGKNLHYKTFQTSSAITSEFNKEYLLNYKDPFEHPFKKLLESILPPFSKGDDKEPASL